MKKIYILIALLLLIPTVCCASQQKYQQSAQALIDFEIMIGELEDFDLSASLTRETAAVWLYRLVGMDMEHNKSDFVDVLSGSEAANAIHTLIEMDVLSGNGDQRFRPKDGVTFAEMSKMLVQLLGYGEVAQERGGYPSGYLLVAHQLNLNNKLEMQYDKPLTVGQGAQILFNSFNADIRGYETLYRQFDTVVNEPKTVLTLFKGIYKYEGRVTVNSKTGLMHPQAVAEGKVEISGRQFLEGKTNAGEYLGKYVTVYYRYDSMDQLVHVMQTRPYGQFTLNAEDVIKESSTRRLVTYNTGDDRVRTYAISPTTDIIYNGRAYPDLPEEKFYPQCGEIIFMDYDNNNEADLLFIKDYSVIFVSHAVDYSQTIYNKYKNTQPYIAIEHGSAVAIWDIFGEQMEFADITENSVLYVSKSLTGDTPIYDILISQKSKTGSLKEIQLEDDSIVVDDQLLELSPFLKNALNSGEADQLVIGGEYTFFLDKDDVAVGCIDLKSYSTKYGYISGIKEGSFSEVQAKIFTNNGGWQIYNVKDKVVFNNTTIRREDFATRVSVNQLVRYKANGAGELSEIYTAVLTDENSTDLKGYIKDDVFRKAEMNNTISNNKYYSNNRSFSNVFFMKSDAVLFLIPTAANAADDDFACTDRSYLSSEARYTMTVYDMDEYMFSSIFVLSYDSTSTTSLESSIGHDDYCLMVNSVRQGHVDGDTVDVVEGLLRGQTWTFTSSEQNTFSDLKRGDVIRTKYDDSGKLRRYVMVHRLGTEDVFTAVDDVNNAVYIKGEALAVDYAGRRIRIMESVERTIVVGQTIVIAVYDSSTNKIREGSLQDINVGNYLVFRMRSSVPYEIFVIN